MWYISKRCAHKASNYNILPAILYTPIEFVPTGFRLAFKWWNFHLGIEVRIVR